MNTQPYAFSIDGQPDYAIATVKIPAQETLKVEASAMASMDTHVSMKTKIKGGFSRWLTKESLFINEFTAEHSAGEIKIAPGVPGQINHIFLNNQAVFLAGSAFLASGKNIQSESKFQGLIKGFFSGGGLFLIKCSGLGDLWFNSFGGMFEVNVEDDYVVDTGHIVGFTEGLEYSVTKVGGYKSLFFSGEGFVVKFKGHGKVWVQTKNPLAFVSWAHRFRRQKK